MSKTAILVACVVLAPGLALAATPTSPTQGQPAASDSATPSPQQPGLNAPQSQLQAGKPTITQKLSQSNGTIHPPAVDPGMTKVPPPTAGTMPIVKPPGNVKSK